MGRATEQREAAATVTRALVGTPQLLVVEGAAGVGKSALARAVAGLMPSEAVVLWARGEEIERHLDFGIVDQLLREASAAGLPAPPTLPRRGTRPDPLDVGELILGLAEEHARDRPLLVVVDDAQWADVPSVQALSFAYRRLRDRRAVLVVVQRDGSGHLDAFDRLVRDGRGERLRLGPLSAAGVAELVRVRNGIVLGARAAERLHRHTGGSPLATVTLVDELDPAVLASGFGPLPAPRSYASLVLGRLASCSPEAERLVASVAVAGALELDALERMTGGVELAGPLSEAIDHGLVEMHTRGGRRVVDVAHPLVRAAVLDDLAPSRLCGLHADAAAALADPDRSFRHELRAHLGRRPELAAEGIRRAHAQLAGGWQLSAIELLVAAADLLGPGPARTEAVLQASHWMLTAGDTSSARELLATVDDAGTPLGQLVRGELALLEGDQGGARVLLEDAMSSMPAPDVAARAAGLLATIAANSARPDEAIEWARRALALAVESGTDAAYAMTMLVSAWALEGDLAAGEAEVMAWAERLGPATAAEPDVRYARGVLALWAGRLAESERLLRALVDDPRLAGPGLLAASARYSLADCWYRQGRWDEAGTLADELARTLDDAGQLLSSPMAHAIVSNVLAGRGNLEPAREHLRAADRAMATSRNIAAGLWVITARARIAVAAGDDAAVVATLTPLADRLRGTALPDGTQPWRADLVAALVATDQVAEAERELADLRARTTGAGPPAVADVARAVGGVAAARGDEVGAEAAFAAGLDEDAVATGALTRARLELAAGAFERRRGRRRAAATLLDRAVERLEALGAEPFLVRARRERSACGVEARPTGQGWTLTRSEAAVAALVAEGRTNREVAATLVVSVKTVESHLARIFDKLAVRSRTELAIEWRLRDAAADGRP